LVLSALTRRDGGGRCCQIPRPLQILLGGDGVTCPPRHTNRQQEILRTLPPELVFEFYEEESLSISSWFKYLQFRLEEALDGMAEGLRRCRRDG